MTVSAPEADDLVVELTDCINALAEQQVALRDSLSVLLSSLRLPWLGEPDSRQRGPAPLEVGSLRVRPIEPPIETPAVQPSEPAAQPVAQPSPPPPSQEPTPAPTTQPSATAEPAVAPPALRRDYDYFDDLDASLAELKADERAESEGPSIGE